MKRNEPVSHIMQSEVITVQVGQKMSDVRAVLTEHGFHHVPVVDGETLVGILSATDILRISYEYQTDSRMSDTVMDHTRSISDVMQSNPVTLAAKDTIRSAAEILAKNWFHALPVVDDDKKLVGMVTTTDLLNYLLAQY
ncbi:MAG: CBS domain-containing protein [Myxococcota bacterium]|jgi:CBS domain-containing protein